MTKEISTPSQLPIVDPLPTSVAAVEDSLKTLLPPSVQRSLDDVVNSDYEVVAYTINGVCPIDDIKTAIAVIDKHSQPMPPEPLGMMIANVYALTKRKASDEMTLNIAIEAYMSKLEQYPADIVHEVLNKWPDQSKWWPSWHELKQEIDWRNSRAKIKAALEKKLAPGRSQSIINEVTKGFTNG